VSNAVLSAPACAVRHLPLSAARAREHRLGAAVRRRNRVQRRHTLYLQDVLGWSPLETGLAFMASSLVTAFVGPRAGALASRVGADLLAVAGGAATLLASLVLLRIGTSADLSVILSARVLAGLGFALAYPCLNIQGLSGIRDDEQGLASGQVGSSFQIAGLLADRVRRISLQPAA
jgi:hypothetical protein